MHQHKNNKYQAYLIFQTRSSFPLYLSKLKISPEFMYWGFPLILEGLQLCWKYKQKQDNHI